MGLPIPRQGGEFTYADYLAWPEDERWELIDGEAHAMSPAPSNFHQLVVGELYRQIATFLRGKPCRPFVAPFDVRLPKAGTANDAIDTVVQPDISVVCDPAKLKDNRGCLGAPDWVIEVVSPGSALRDQKVKRALYERHGVAEYWLAHPVDRSIAIYRSGERGYDKPLLFGRGETCAPSAFPNLDVAVDEVFIDLPPQDDAALG